MTDREMSPVIGVILMVAITVILAAVIAAFVFGMIGDIPEYHCEKSIEIEWIDGSSMNWSGNCTDFHHSDTEIFDTEIFINGTHFPTKNIRFWREK